MADTVTVSQGNTFACNFVWTPGTTGPANLLTTTITSTLQDKCGNEYQMTVTKAVDGLSFLVAYDGDTSNWATGLGRWDIKFAFSSTSISRTEVFRINVIDSVTK